MSGSKEFITIEAEGSAYEIGFAHGTLGKKQVLNSINTYKVMFKDYSNLSWDLAKERSRAYIEPIQNYDKDIMEEIRGVAEGAGVDIEDILALNARSEVIMMTGSAVPSGGCTSCAITPESTLSGNTILAQNWDWKGDQIESMVVLKIKQKNKPNITMITEGGIIGKIGFNSCGLGVCLNALGMKGNPKGLPLHVILRGILNREKISDAIERINSVQNACAANYLIAHKVGEALDVEKAPGDFDVLYPVDGIITHSNHFTVDRLKPNDTLRLMASDSYMRKGRSDKLLRQYKGKIDINVVKSVLRDHADYPDAICRHTDPKDDPGLAHCTVFSIIMDLSAQQMYVTKGAPCESEYQLIK